MADAIGGSLWEGSLLNLLSLLIISDYWSCPFLLSRLCCLLKEEGIVKARVSVM